jgi:flagellar motor protein MotB
LPTEWVDITLLQMWGRNPRKGDVEKVAESLKAHGQIKPIGVNRGTKTGRENEIIFGNHTYMGAKKLGWKEIWVTWFDVDDLEFKRIGVADNGAADGSGYHEDVLGEILTEIKEEAGTLTGTTYTDDILGKLVTNATDENASVDKIEDAPDQLDGVEELNNFVFFPSNIDFDIPELRLEMIPEEPLEPMRVWAGHELDGKDIIGEEEWGEMWWLAMWHAGSRGINWKKAIPYFYTDDFHFEPIYNDPAKNTKKILNLGIQYCFMPNYTIHAEMPVALWVYAAYRSFYVARYFQEAGLMVIPDIQTGMDDAVLDLTLSGIPQGCGVVATQAQMSKGDKNAIRKKARLLKEAEDRIGFKNIIVYGHTDADEVVERADFSANVIRVTARTARRREYLNSGSTINTQKVKSGKKKRKVVKK